ncbi:MAG: hypothetical protein H7346_15460 [Burkholderiaceae bacterium]|nr:hypothetical protein [Burkholderiaceae bacterium]
MLDRNGMSGSGYFVATLPHLAIYRFKGQSQSAECAAGCKILPTMLFEMAQRYANILEQKAWAGFIVIDTPA